MSPRLPCCIEGTTCLPYGYYRWFICNNMILLNSMTPKIQGHAYGSRRKWYQLTPLPAGVQLWLRPACGLNFSRSQPGSRVFSPGTPVFLPHQNRLTANSHLAVVLCSDIKHGLYSGSQRRLGILTAQYRELRHFVIQSSILQVKGD